MPFTLPKLPFSAEALEDRGMSAETFSYHHGKHHRKYVDDLNAIVAEDVKLKDRTVEQLIALSAGKPSKEKLFNNAGQHFNHSFFWNSLSPDGGRMPSELKKKISRDFGSVDAFKKTFREAAVSQFGSGWAWLVLGKNGKLKVTKSANAESPISKGDGAPLLTLDVWEHAYYIDFRNARLDFTSNFLNRLANYDFAEETLLAV